MSKSGQRYSIDPIVRHGKENANTKHILQAHMFKVSIGQMHSWKQCSKSAARYDWLIVTRPDVLFRSKMSRHREWNSTASMIDTDPREKVMVMQNAHIPDISQGWQRWKNCVSFFPDLGCATRPETILQRETSASRVPLIKFGNPTILREYANHTFSEY